MVQQIRPDADIAAGGWGPAPLYSKIDEASPGGDVIASDGGSGPSGNYPVGTIAHLGFTALGSALPNQTNLTKYVLGVPPYSSPATGPWLKLAYNSASQSFSSGLQPGGPLTTGGVKDAWTQARSLGAVLHNASGQEWQYNAGGGGLLVDAGNPSWQAACLTAARNFFAANPNTKGCYWDNFIDDISGFNGACTIVGTSTNLPVGYPVYNQSGTLLFSNAAQYAAAQVEFAQNVLKPLRDEGHFVTVNGRTRASDVSGYSAWIDQYAPYVGAMGIEYFAHHGGGSTSVWLQDGIAFSSWNGLVGVQEHVHSLGLGFCPFPDMSSSSTYDAMARYITATYLLAWNGITVYDQIAGSGAILYVPLGGANQWNANLDKDLGMPTGPRVARTTADSNNAQVWRRNYDNGFVLVNPSNASKTVVEPEGSFTIPSGDAVLRVG